ncbi:MAG: hypothetical protein RL664_1854 [Bacteroidota bacterium]
MLSENISNILLDFEPISLLEMDRVKLMNRIDTKFAFSKKQLVQILPDLAADYKILEIEATATDDEVKKAFRKMAMKYHPDKVKDLGDEYQKAAQEKFIKVQEAYDQLRKERGMK